MNNTSDKEKSLLLAKTAKGQLEKVIEMIEEERYCVDISNQILAVLSLVKKTNLLILRKHINSCVKDAFLSGKGDESVDEIMMLFDKISK